MESIFYVCDGGVAACPKTSCAFNGSGECMHTSDKRHARYDEPREWRTVGGAIFEKVREPLGS